MNEFFIGRFQLGWRMVNLYADPDAKGAWFNLCRDGQDAQIHCGMGYSDAAMAFNVLCHEVLEMCMEDMGLAFRPHAFIDSASDLPRFFFDHNQHTELAGRTSFFLWTCIEDFKAAHDLCHPKP